MRYLLDTHVLIWWWNTPERLSERAMNALERYDSDVAVSAICGLEIGIKVRLGQLSVMEERVGTFDASVLADGFVHLPITHAHAVKAGLKSGAYRDPFDRLIAAQALIEDMTVITRDREIAAFGCEVLW